MHAIRCVLAGMGSGQMDVSPLSQNLAAAQARIQQIA